MRKEIVKVFSYEELSEEAKKCARDWYRSILDRDFSFESQMITENFEIILEKKGYPTEDIEWSLSYCQGDGVAFYGSIQDIDKVAKRLLSEADYKLFNLIFNDHGLYIDCEIFRNSYGYHYSHYNTMEIELDHEDIDTIVYEVYGLEEHEEGYENKYIDIENLLDTLEEAIKDDIKEVSKQLEKLGYKEIEYYYEAVEEALITNEYEFLENGKRYQKGIDF
ncbi:MULTISPECIES: hypothetical protein [Bacillati]|uniref:hypothetical protein n=1 Tax=Bacillati TaxID=1783272 RepID=UPI001D03061E|nr:hypothetical protein [Collinsella aerofaciens]MCB5366963.1 hypothetical protein [Collinsella aerofaciens]MCB5368996.1 hypothetical protein [Collinsella aerofaciens]